MLRHTVLATLTPFRRLDEGKSKLIVSLKLYNHSFIQLDDEKQTNKTQDENYGNFAQGRSSSFSL